MNNTKKFIQRFIPKANKCKEKFAKFLLNLSTEEKLLAGFIFFVLAIFVIFPKVFWIGTALTVCYFVGDNMSKKEKKKDAEEKEITSETN